MSARLAIEGVTTAYDKADVLEDVTLSIEPGRITCLLGSNGSGKSTLIRSILGLTPPRVGQITFDGADITGLPTHKVIAAGIACIPEGRKVFPKLTVEENLRLGAYQEPSDTVTQERMAELKLYLQSDPEGRQGFRTLLVGPTHPDYGAFCMGAGHGIGFNDQKTVEVRDLIDGIAADAPMWPDFEEGWKVSRILDAIALSHQSGRWVNVSEIV